VNRAQQRHQFFEKAQALVAAESIEMLIPQLLQLLTETAPIQMCRVFIREDAYSATMRGQYQTGAGIVISGGASTDTERVQLVDFGRNGWVEANGLVSVPIVDGSQILGGVRLTLHDGSEPEDALWDVEVVLRFAGVAISRLLSETAYTGDFVEEVERTRVIAMKDFAAAVAHQVSNPLTTIMVDTELLLEQTAEDEALNKSLLAVYRAGRRIAEVVQRLITFTHPVSSVEGGLRKVDPRDSIFDVLDVLRAYLEAAGIELSLALEDPVPSVMARPDVLSIVWFNLLLNARDELAEIGGGKLGIEAYTTPGMSESVDIVFWDTGRGIQEEAYEQIFEPFFTTKPRTERTGLGLHLCRRSVRALGGDIFISEQEGGGARFTVRLPKQKG